MNREQLQEAVAAALVARHREARHEAFHAEHGHRIREWSRGTTEKWRLMLEQTRPWELLSESEREHWREVVAPTLSALEQIGALRWGKPNVYCVRIDDPSQSGPHVYEIEAFSAWEAMHVAARRAIREDPKGAGLNPDPGHHFPPIEQAENPALIENVAMYGNAVPLFDEKMRNEIVVAVGKA